MYLNKSQLQDNFLIHSKNTSTDFYRVDVLVKELQDRENILSNLLEKTKNLKHSPESTTYEETISKIRAELTLLLSTQGLLKELLNNLHEKGTITHRSSYDMAKIEERIQEMWKEVEKMNVKTVRRDPR